MIYIRKRDEFSARSVANFDSCGNIAKSGSVVGMRKLYGWPEGGQVRLGGYIYNVGTVAVQKLRDAGLIRGG